MNRPSWDDYLLGLTKCVARRSHDVQTQHGCVLIGEDHRILATGCNGFPRGMKHDSDFPDVRPGKYKWMIHSEQNAIANANGPIDGSIAYITGKPCLSCLMHLWQNGIKKVIYIDGSGWSFTESEMLDVLRFIDQTGIVVIKREPDLSWLVDMVLDDPKLLSILKERGYSNGK